MVSNVEPEELAAAIKHLSEWAEQHAPQPRSPVRIRLREHFGCDPAELPVVSWPLEAWDRPNLQVAIDAWLAGTSPPRSPMTGPCASPRTICTRRLPSCAAVATS